MIHSRTILLFVLLVSMVCDVSGQPNTVQFEGTVPDNMTRAAQYYIGDMNELMMRVNVWGRVLKPGQYYVPSTTDLITLISAAGGPAEKCRLDNVHIVRSGEGGSQVIEVDVRKYLKTGDSSLIPVLKPEDTVIVSGSMWYLISQVAVVAAQFAIMANVYYWLFVKGA